MKEIIIKLLFYYEFVFIFLFCSLSFLFLAIFIKQKIIKKILISFFSLFFVLFICELFFSCLISFSIAFNIGNLMGKNNFTKDRTIKLIEQKCKSNITKDETETIRHIKLYSKDEELKFIDLKDKDIDDNLLDKYSVLFDKNYTIYEDNIFRFTKCNPYSEEVYVFLGCSFTFGYGVNDDETLPYYFSELYNFNKNIINCGVNSKSTNTSITILNNKLFLPFVKNEDARIKYFVYTIIYDQVIRNFNYKLNVKDVYRYLNNKWYIPTKIGKLKYIFANSYVWELFIVPAIDNYLKQYYEDYIVQSLKEMDKIIKEKYKSKLVIIFNDDIVYFESFINKLKNSDLDLILLPRKLCHMEEGYRLKDWHPSAKANKEIAEILYNHINEENKTN